MREFHAIVDGAALTNPGPIYCAYIVREGDATILKECTHHGTGTNNEAEWCAVIAPIVRLKELIQEPFRITIHSDSELVVRQWNGTYRIRTESLKQLWATLTVLVEDGVDLELKWVPRTQTEEAHRLIHETVQSMEEARQ